MKHLLGRAGLVAAAVLLASCGGGGGDQPPSAANQLPVAAITSPANGATFKAGDTVSFTGSGTDAEDGNLPANRLTWWAELHHDTHTHPFQPETAGATGSVTIPTQGETSANIFYRFHLRATDSAGATHEVTRDIQPQISQVNVTTNPPGLALTLDGQPTTTPTTFTGVVGIERALGAAAQQNSTGAMPRRYQFLNWSDGGTATHTVSTPAANTTYTANYQDVGPVNNTPPTVALSAPANNSTGTVGIAISLAATAADSDGTVTGVEFFENGVKIGATDTSAPYGVSWTPATTGVRTLTAVATDDLGLSTTSAAVMVTIAASPNQPPIAAITAPAAGATFRAGDTLTFSGTGSDAEDGTLAGARLTWWAELHHDTHTHPFMPETIGASGSVTIPTQGETSANIFYRFHLRATDSGGATTEVTRDIQPQKSQVTVASAPAGLALTLDGQPMTGPTAFTGVVGMERALGAASLQNFNGRRYQFQSWSDGGAATHTISTPAANTTYTATYQDIGPVNNSPPTVVLTAPANNSSGTVGVAINLAATAADTDGTVSGVEFFENGVKVGATDTTAPYGVTWTPATTGARNLTARATDDQGLSATSAIVVVTIASPPVNQPPVATIATPIAGTTFRAGDTISFSGSGTDPEDGNLAANRLTWWAELHHDTHSHPFLAETTGLSGQVTIPTQGEKSDNIFYRFHLRATDSAGATNEVTRDIQPQKSLVTVTSTPVGLALTLDGQPITAPTTFTGVVGIERTLGAAAMQNLDGRKYQFQSWSDGGAASHTISTPVSNTTYVATYQDVGAVNNTPPTVALTAPAANSSHTQGVVVNLSATATDVDGNATITGVEFFENGVKIGATDTTVPYGVAWTPATLGSRTLTARATDDQGASADSAAVTVTVNAPASDVQPPVATLTAPANLAANLAGTITLTATATDNVGVASIEFQVDGVTIGGLDTAAPYTTSVDSNLYASGQHVVRARARDAAGNVSNWASATVEFGGGRTQPSGFSRSSGWVTGIGGATAFAQAPDGRLFVAQQGGQLRIVKNGVLLVDSFIDLSSLIDDSGERGLIGVALHPSFATNGWVYVHYTSNTAPVHNRIVRITASPPSADVYTPGSETPIAELPNLSTATNHNGGAMHFGADGKLYVALGDNADSSNAPLLSTRLGKLLRLNDDGTIPADNPFYGTTSADNRSIWATGLRNPFTFAVRPSDGRIHINDVGESTWEEVNLGAPGANYGWPSTEGPTSASGVTAPLFAYDHDPGASPGGFFSGCAITGGAFYPDSGPFPAAYRGSYFFTDYCTAFVGRVDLANGNVAYAFGSLDDSPVDMLVGIDGALYVLGRGSITRFTAP